MTTHNDHEKEISLIQERWKPTTLVLGSLCTGRFPHLIYPQLGCLLQLCNEDLMSNVKKIVGVNMGALIGLLMCINMDIVSIIFSDLETGLLESIISHTPLGILEAFGLSNRGNCVKERVEEMVLEQLSTIPTLEGLYLMTNMELVVCVYNTENEKVEYISRQSNPKMNCIEAVFLSTDFTSSVFSKNKYVDASFINPYPVETYDVEDEKVLGLLTKIGSCGGVKKGLNLFGDMMTIGSLELSRRIIENCSNRCRHIKISTSSLVEDDMDGKVSLVQDGVVSAKKFVKDHNLTLEPFEKREIDIHGENMEEVSVDGVTYYQESHVEKTEETTDKPEEDNDIVVQPRERDYERSSHKLRIKITPEMSKILHKHSARR